MKTEWLILLISAGTDALISFGTAVSAAMVTQGSVAMPSRAVLLLATVGGLVAAARTIQQALKATPSTIAGLRGGLRMVSQQAMRFYRRVGYHPYEGITEDFG